MNDYNSDKILIEALNNSGSEKDQLNCIGRQLTKLLYNTLQSNPEEVKGKIIEVKLPPLNQSLETESSKNGKFNKYDNEVQSLINNIKSIAFHATKHNVTIQLI